MHFFDPMILNLAVALGIGLLIGAERERRKGEGPSRSPAGIRTFTVASLAGAISLIVGGEVLFAIATAGVILLSTVALARGRRRSRPDDRNRLDRDYFARRSLHAKARPGSRSGGYTCRRARRAVLA